MKQEKDFVLSLFVVSPILAAAFSMITNTNFLMSVILFLVIPSVVLSALKPGSIIKSALFSVVSIPALLTIDYISLSMGQRIIPDTVFPFKFLGTVPVENLIWAYFMCYEVIMFYEYFFDSQKPKEYFRKKFIPLLTVSFIVPTLYFIIGFIYPAIFKIRYFYAMWGTFLLIVPLFLFLINHQKLLGKFVITGFYFFYLALCYELTALAKGWWYFPRSSEFIGWIDIGKLLFPLEEFVFWLMLFAMGFLSWYEYFDDDLR